MRHRLAIVLILASCYPAPAEGLEREKLVRKDLFGDPLPKGVIARLGAVRLYHDDGVNCCCFLPNALTLATGGIDGTVRFWDSATGKEQRVFRGHTAPITCVAFTPESKIMASASWDNTVRLWDVESAKPLHVLASHERVVLRCLFAPDGKTLVTSGRDALRQWEFATGKELLHFTVNDNPISLACTLDGRRVISAGYGNAIRIWDVSTTHQCSTMELSKDSRLVVVSPDGKLLAQETSVNIRSSCSLWDSPD